MSEFMDNPTLPPGGWINDPTEVDGVLATIDRPLFAQAAPQLSGSGTDKTVLLYKAFKDANGGSYIPYPAQTIGDCLTPDAMVRAPGGAVPIGKLQIGDLVYTGKGETTHVISTRSILTNKLIVEVSWRNDRSACSLRCTKDHKFWVFRPSLSREEWVDAGSLVVGDLLLTPTSPGTLRRCEVVDVISLPGLPCLVHDIGVADEHHSFLANNIAVHNCVSHGTAHGVDLLSAVQITIGKSRELFKQTATEAVYGMARVAIGGQRGSYRDGAVGAWAAKAVSTLGTVSRDVVGPYSGQRAKDWGATGVPDAIAKQAVDHKVRTVALVSTYEELEDALANGYPVPVCSNRGFTLQRDADGFCLPSGRWDHCMLIVGTRTGNRPGACIFQSWGMEMPSGPLALDQPPNSFWADRDVVAGMLAMNDSWALSQFDGYPDQTIPDHWKYGGFA